MKTKINTLLVCLALYCMVLSSSYAQCLPMIKIDGNDIIADENSPSGIKLPSWLAAGQTLAQSQNVYSIAIIEFTINGTALDYSQNKSITTVQTVPAGKVWKLESIHKDPALTPIINSYTTPGTYSFTPTCTGRYLVKVWGAGGGGGGAGAFCGGSGGGAGGYAEDYYYLYSTTTYNITVGAGSTGGVYNLLATATAGGSSSVSIININGFGGNGGGYTTCDGPGGIGGYGDGAKIILRGATGSVPTPSPTGGGSGAIGYNNIGNGGKGSTSGSGLSGLSGGNGKVEITLSSNSSSAAKVPCVAMYLYNSACAGSCPAGWTDAGCGFGASGAGGNATVRTCYRCD